MSAHPSTMLSAPLSWAAGSQICPACGVVHETTCAKFWEAYARFNLEMAAKLVGIRTPPAPKPPACACGAAKRAFAIFCDGCLERAGRGRR